MSEAEDKSQNEPNVKFSVPDRRARKIELNISSARGNNFPSAIDTEPIRISTGNVYNVTHDAVERLSQTEPNDIQGIASSQIQLLTGFYQLVLDQARKSFRWALIAAGVGLGFFLAAVGFILYLNAGNAATVSVISGGLVEVIAAINFYLYSKTSGHLADFHNKLEGTQRYLLANSMCESLDDAHKQTARSELVRAIAGISVSPEAETEKK